MLYYVYHEPNAVEISIHNRRRKIDDPRPSKLVHTVCRADYRLTVNQDATTQ